MLIEITPTRQIRGAKLGNLRNKIAELLENRSPVTSVSGNGAQIAIEICIDRGWPFTISVVPELGERLQIASVTVERQD